MVLASGILVLYLLGIDIKICIIMQRNFCSCYLSWKRQHALRKGRSHCEIARSLANDLWLTTYKSMSVQFPATNNCAFSNKVWPRLIKQTIYFIYGPNVTEIISSKCLQRWGQKAIQTECRLFRHFHIGIIYQPGNILFMNIDSMHILSVFHTEGPQLETQLMNSNTGANRHNISAILEGKILYIWALCKLLYWDNVGDNFWCDVF